MIFRIIVDNFETLKIMGKENFDFYNAISPFNIRFFDGQQEMGNALFNPKNQNQIFQSPVYEDGKQPLKIKIQQYIDPTMKRECLLVHNLGTLVYKNCTKANSQFLHLNSTKSK